MKVRITGEGGGEKKAKSTAPTSAEIAAANKFAKNFAARRGLITGEDTHVGGQIPKFVDARTGRELTEADKVPQVGGLADKVPLYVKGLEWDDQMNLPYYVDEKTGDTKYVKKELFHSPRFNPNRGKSMLPLIASR